MLSRISRDVLLIVTCIINIIAFDNSICCANSSDTSQVRQMWYTFSDGTIIKYIHGPVIWSQGGTRSFLAYSMDTSGAFPNNYLKTEPFTLSGTDDTIWASRFVNYDNYSKMTTTRGLAQAQTTLQLGDSVWRSAYAGFNATPSSAVFSSTSSVLFITELRLVASDSVIWSSDTTKCYLNSSSQLRYQNYPPSYSLALITPDVPTPRTGQSVYLAIRVVNSLPSGSNPTYTGQTGINPNNNASTFQPDFVGIFTYQEGYPYDPGLKKVGNPSSNPINGSTLSLKTMTQITGGLSLTFSSNFTDAGLIQIFDVVGREIYSKQVDISTGINAFDVPTAGFKDGNYIIRVSSEGMSSSGKFQIKSSQ